MEHECIVVVACHDEFIYEYSYGIVNPRHQIVFGVVVIVDDFDVELFLDGGISLIACIIDGITVFFMCTEFVLGDTEIGGTFFDVVSGENFCFLAAEILFRKIGVFSRFFGDDFGLGFGCRGGICGDRRIGRITAGDQRLTGKQQRKEQGKILFHDGSFPDLRAGKIAIIIYHGYYYHTMKI